jgi:hypothetical protein
MSTPAKLHELHKAVDNGAIAHLLQQAEDEIHLILLQFCYMQVRVVA